LAGTRQDFAGGQQDFSGASRNYCGSDLGFCGDAGDNGGRLRFNLRFGLGIRFSRCHGRILDAIFKRLNTDPFTKSKANRPTK
jgi:hypothetical protein